MGRDLARLDQPSRDFSGAARRRGDRHQADQEFASWGPLNAHAEERPGGVGGRRAHGRRSRRRKEQSPPTC